ncbi:hypothetical protein TNCV_3880991 [Trichonephila clavipes]|nr:hypothetical protein TNCV_3880991 [Trichonephila clavipes]
MYPEKTTNMLTIDETCFNRAHWRLSRFVAVTVDVLFSDIFENFRTLCQNYYKIDPCNTYMVPGLNGKHKMTKEKTTQLSAAGTKQLNSSVGTKQSTQQEGKHCRQLSPRNETTATACDRRQPPTTACNRLTAYDRLQLLQPRANPACNRLQPPTTAYKSPAAT